MKYSQGGSCRSSDPLQALSFFITTAVKVRRRVIKLRETAMDVYYWSEENTHSPWVVVFFFLHSHRFSVGGSGERDSHSDLLHHVLKCVSAAVSVTWLNINTDWMSRHSVTRCRLKSSNFSTSSDGRDDAMDASSRLFTVITPLLEL